jgi:hypothetical protein
VVETVALEYAPPGEKARPERQDDPQDREGNERLDEEDSAGAAPDDSGQISARPRRAS